MTLKEKQIRLCIKIFLPVKFLKMFLSNISSVFRYSPLFHLITIDKSCCNSFYGCAITIRINYSSFSYKCQKRENKCLALVSKHDNFFITDQIFSEAFQLLKILEYYTKMQKKILGHLESIFWENYWQ